MKKVKSFYFISFCSFLVLFSLSLTTSCNNKQEEMQIQDNQLINNYIKSLNPKIKNNKVNLINETLASSINSKDKVEEWFDGLPFDNNGIVVSFISSTPLSTDVTTLEIKYLISKNSYQEIYSFKISGFKDPNFNKPIENDQEIIDSYIKSLNPKIKNNKVNLINETLASSINSKDKVEEWFDGLPFDNNGIVVSFISSTPLSTDVTTLEIKYLISKNSYQEIYLFKISGFKDPSILPPDIEPNQNLTFQQYAEKNSFKLIMSVKNRKFFLNGTAWSWYYYKHSESLYDWYLMTNFHVVNNAIADANGLLLNNGTISNSNQLLNYYENNIITNYDISGNAYFDLLNYTNNQYKSLVSANKTISQIQQMPLHDNSVKKENIESIDIITDFKNDEIDLFSKKFPNTGENYYNLDMALIKISFNFENDKTFINDKFKRQNIIEIYENDLNNKNMMLNFQKGMNIAGNPTEDKKLVVYNSTNTLKSTYSYSNLDIIDQILPNLRAPYYYLNNAELNVNLTGGASGAAVYQLENPNSLINWNKILPVGIYWGGITHPLDNNKFSPSLIPFIFENSNIEYNVFDSFISLWEI